MFGLERLPETIPVFPLTGALLLPKGHLPLNIFEPRYLDMVYYARERNGLFGMVQPATDPLHQQGNDQLGTAPRNRPLYKTGCMGMISDLRENKDGSLRILLTGLSRFDIEEELPFTQTFRMVRVIYDHYKEDCAAPLRSEDIPRQKLVLAVEKYLKLNKITPRWEALEKACDEELVNALAMICPFDAAEKQALLEAMSLKDRVELMLKIMAFDLFSGQAATRDKILQ
ncbi:MAG: LON peptidase substrate-binding domain-containing protein [Emcibacter sp.]|nr:LON peptidase substrate-binding domain-containing protein [Emcibacter sp.]